MHESRYNQNEVRANASAIEVKVNDSVKEVRVNEIRF